MSSESGVKLGTPGKGTALYGQALGTANSVEAMDITVDKQHAVPARRHRRVPWSPRAWGQALYLAAGIPAQLIAALILFAVVRWSEVMDPRGIARLGLLWLACVVVIFLLSPVLTQVHRHRLRVTAGVEIPPQPKRGLLTWRGLAAVAPLAGDLAAALLPRARRPRARGGGGRRRRAVAGQRRVHGRLCHRVGSSFGEQLSRPPQRGTSS